MNFPQMLMIDLSGPSLTPDERAFLNDHPVGGVCLFARNITGAEQTADYVAELRQLAGDTLLVATDQEGGGVVRAPFLPYPPGAMALGAADDVDLTRRVAAATARGLRALGINLDFAPVADVNNNPHNPVIADRSFGANPEQVARHVVAFVQGLQAEGVAATAKHFPGHGDTNTDSHLALPRLEVGRERLERTELPPFIAAIAADVAAIMTFHGLVPALDPDHPATLSRRTMTGLLRDALGFDGVIISDALSMRAIADTYGPAEAAVRAVEAGVDMPLHTRHERPIGEHEEILQALETALHQGRLDEAHVNRSLGRIAALARRYPARPALEYTRQAGDEALLDEAAARALVALGELKPLEPGSSLCLVSAQRVVTGAASDGVSTPAGDLAAHLSAAGFRVEHSWYDRDDPAADRAALLAHAQQADTTLFVSTARTRMEGAEKALGLEVARVARGFVHVALWNPYHVLDLPGPALLTFGFRAVSAKAAARALAGGGASGQPPIPLYTSGDGRT